MANFASRVAGLHTLATRRLGGDEWVINGVTVEALYSNRYQKVAFGDERFKNVDMAGVSINAVAPALRLPTNTVPYGSKRGAEVYLPGSDEYFTIKSTEDDSGMTTIRLKREA